MRLAGRCGRRGDQAPRRSGRCVLDGGCRPPAVRIRCTVARRIGAPLPPCPLNSVTAESCSARSLLRPYSLCRTCARSLCSQYHVCVGTCSSKRWVRPHSLSKPFSCSADGWLGGCRLAKGRRRAAARRSWLLGGGIRPCRRAALAPDTASGSPPGACSSPERDSLLPAVLVTGLTTEVACPNLRHSGARLAETAKFVHI